MLGRMRSGPFDYSDDVPFVGALLAESSGGPDAFAQTPQRMLDVAFSHPPHLAPGSDYRYSNTNTVLLALVVEKVSGLPFGEYLRQHNFVPAGLSRTSYPDHGALPGPHTHGYLELPDGPVIDATFWNPSWADAAAKIVSTTADLSRWARTLGTGALLRPETQALRLAAPSPRLHDGTGLSAGKGCDAVGFGQLRCPRGPCGRTDRQGRDSARHARARL